MERHSPIPSSEWALHKMLDSRYGDGSVYLPTGSGTALYGKAQATGLLNPDNFITRKGRQFLAVKRH